MEQLTDFNDVGLTNKIFTIGKPETLRPSLSYMVIMNTKADYRDTRTIGIDLV